MVGARLRFVGREASPVVPRPADLGMVIVACLSSQDSPKDVPRMELPSLSIVIPTYNGLNHLERCLTSVQQYAPPGTQVIVVDDGSTDGTCFWLRKKHPEVEVLALPSNHGFCGAVNAGVARARREVVEMLNNDTEVSPGWAESALKHFADPSVGSVAPLVVFFDRPQVIDSAGQEYHICGWGKNRGYGHVLNEKYA